MITTPDHEIEPGLDLSLRFLEPIKARNEELLKRVATLEAILWRAVHSPEAFAEWADEQPWGATLTAADVRRLTDWADLENERRAG